MRERYQEFGYNGLFDQRRGNAFLREHYINEFDSKFTVAAMEKATAFRKISRTDLNWIFTVQTERAVAKNNTVVIGDRHWQLEKSRFRSSLADCRVTIHEHLNGDVSIRYGPHVVGRFTAATPETKPESRGKGVPTAPTHPLSHSRTKTRKPPSASRRGSKDAID